MTSKNEMVVGTIYVERTMDEDGNMGVRVSDRTPGGEHIDICEAVGMLSMAQRIYLGGGDRASA